MTRTLRRARPSTSAALRPAGPAPTTMQSHVRLAASLFITDPVSRATSVPWASSEVQARGDFDDEDRCDHEVDGHAERRPPAGVGDEVGAVLPEVFESVSGQRGDQQPRWPGDGDRREDHEAQ